MTSSVAPLEVSGQVRSPSIFSAAVRGFLRAPLVLKLMGANVIIAAIVLIVLGNGLRTTEQNAVLVVLLALAAAFVANLLLVRIALRPIAELERVATSVSNGKFEVRAQPSVVADSQLAHVTDTVNSLLDSLAAERRRIQKLGAEVLSTQDTERARLARELHDSIAQTLAAVRFQLSAASSDTSGDEMRNRLSAARGMIGKAMDEVRNISQSLHPRMAEDLGLVTALEALASQFEESGRLRVVVKENVGDRWIPSNVAATLFRVAQEALKAAETRAACDSVDILLYTKGDIICLEVKCDKGRVDITTASADNSNAGLLSIMDRVELSGGVMRIETGKDGGARVTAEINIGEKAS